MKKHQKRYWKNIPVEDVVLHKCDNCGKAFKTKGNFTKHKKICTTKPVENFESVRYKCSNCGEKFFNRRDLYIHRQLQHGGGIGQDGVDDGSTGP